MRDVRMETGRFCKQIIYMLILAEAVHIKFYSITSLEAKS